MFDWLLSAKFIVAFALALLWLLESFFPAAPAGAQRVRHAVRNLTLGALNAGLTALLLAGLIVAVANWTAAAQVGLLPLLPLPPLAATVLAIVLLDGGMYGWHRANHAVPLLWRLHRVHHSDLAMDATSAVRFHAGEILLSGLLRAALIPVLGLSSKQILLYDTLLLPVILFHHSNVHLPEQVDRILRVVLTTPALHRVHHARIRSEADSNYGSIFSGWDRLLQTLRVRHTRVDFGVDGFDSESQQTVSGLLQMPFTNASSATRVWSSVAPVPVKPPRLQ